MAAGTTRNEQIHSRLNAHYRATIAISKRTLAAELKTWLACEQAVWLRAFGSRFTRRVSRANILPQVAASTTIFRQREWQAHLGEAKTEWACHPQGKASRGQKRRGPSHDQSAVYDAIRAKTVKRPRSSVYQP